MIVLMLITWFALMVLFDRALNVSGWRTELDIDERIAGFMAFAAATLVNMLMWSTVLNSLIIAE